MTMPSITTPPPHYYPRGSPLLPVAHQPLQLKLVSWVIPLILCCCCCCAWCPSIVVVVDASSNDHTRLERRRFWSGLHHHYHDGVFGTTLRNGQLLSSLQSNSFVTTSIIIPRGGGGGEGNVVEESSVGGGLNHGEDGNDSSIRINNEDDDDENESASETIKSAQKTASKTSRSRSRSNSNNNPTNNHKVNGKKEVKADDTDNSSNIIPQRHHQTLNNNNQQNQQQQSLYTLKRGTRTTGVGASKRRNPSIFSSVYNTAAGLVAGDESPSSIRWTTAAALSGDVLNRQSSPKSSSSTLLNKKTKSSKKMTKKHDNDDEAAAAKLNTNPMLGRLWAGQSDRGTLIFKFDHYHGEEGGGRKYVELSEEVLPSSNNNIHDDNNSSNNKNAKNSKRGVSSSRVHARFINATSSDGDEQQFDNDSNTHIMQSSISTTNFVPIEGIYGIFHLPCSGPHAVLITESENVYQSPPPSSSFLHNDDEYPPPLLELRRIKSLEIVSLRPKKTTTTTSNNNDTTTTRSQNDNKSSFSFREEQLAEESRQLRLLRKSFKEHDFYFTKPPPPPTIHTHESSAKQQLGSSAVVHDITHSLQRSFLGWSEARNNNNNRRKEESKEEQEHGTKNLNQQHRWWIPYYYTDKNNGDNDDEGESPSSSSSDNKNSRGSHQRRDPRFFWNEQPALSLLPPHPPSHPSGNNASLLESSSPYALLLDHVIPVTSAFVGVQRNVPIPSPPPSPSTTTTKAAATTVVKEKYDQILISRRSKYRTGTRFTRRGTDDTGAVANYAETEQICFIVGYCDDDDGSGTNNDKEEEDDDDDDSNTSNHRRRLLEVYSHVQTRGSIPLHWSSPANVKAYRPRVYIGVDPMVQARGLRDHVLGELWCYSSSSLSSSSSSGGGGGGGEENSSSTVGTTTETKLSMVNLIDKHGDQGRLGTAFDSVLSAVMEVYGSSSPEVPNGDQEDQPFQSKEKKKEKKKKKEKATIKDPPSLLLRPGSVEHIWYDFHAECKGGRWDRLSQLLERVTPALDTQGYFCAVPTNSNDKDAADTACHWDIQSLQDGVVRTNCMDCLDRTNVVQSMFGRYMLYRQLYERLGLTKKSSSTRQQQQQRPSRRRTLPLECVVGYKRHPLTLPWTQGESSHRYLWADNADAISRLYAGTPALKGDFTRTGQRTKRGALDDGVNSLQRYYLNNFIDADRQEGMDLLVGSAEFNVVPIDDGDDESSRVFVMQELAKSSNKRRGYDETHARIKVKSPDDEDSRMQRLSLNWLPGDLRHHMRNEALRSRSPLSPAAEEENIENAPRSSDFLLQVTSSAATAGGEEAGAVHDTHLEVLHSIDRRGSSAKPWWVAVSSSSVEEDHDNESDPDPDGGYLKGGGKHLQLNARNVLGFARKRTVATSLLLLTKAPIISAVLIAAVIASGFYSQSCDDEEDEWDSDN